MKLRHILQVLCHIVLSVVVICCWGWVAFIWDDDTLDNSNDIDEIFILLTGLIALVIGAAANWIIYTLFDNGRDGRIYER